MEKNTLTRQELYDLVWQESLTAISKRLNIPYSHLRKICQEMKVPVPPNGHWSKLQFGKPVEIIELPKDYSGANEIKLYPSQNDIGNPKVITLYKKTAADLIREDKTLPLKVPKTLSNPDELILEAQKQLMDYKHNKHNDDDMVRYEGVFTIRVSRRNIGRTLRFMDTLIKLLRERGYKLKVELGRLLYIDDQHFDFKLMEKTQKGSPDPKWGLPRFENTGLLYFEIKGVFGRTWTDGKILIDERLVSILAKIESTIDFWKENHRINEEARLKREEKERIIREQRELVEKERAAFDDLYQQAKRWQRARFIREYLNDYEQNAIEKGRLTDEVRNWLTWARDKVDWYDPFVKKEDVILGYFK